jgi:hypothetical protein
MTMPVDKLSAEQEKRIIRGIEKVIGLTNKGEAANGAFLKVAKEMQFSPEITRRACEAFNKSKTVHMLSQLASDRRADSFELVDPDAVVQGIFGEPMKKAAEVVKCFDEPSMQKAASVVGLAIRPSVAGSVGYTRAKTRKKGFSDPDASTLEDILNRSPIMTGEEEREPEIQALIHEQLGLGKQARAAEVKDFKHRAEQLDTLYRAKSRMGQHKLAFEMAVKDAIGELRQLPPDRRRRTAQALVDGMGEIGIGLVKMAAAGLDEDLPSVRSSSFAVLDDSRAVRAFRKAAAEAEAYAEHINAFGKLAGYGTELVKSLASAGSTIAGGVAGAAGESIGSFSDATVKALAATSAGKPTADMVTDAVLDPKFTNLMDSLNNQQAFVTIATDPVMSKYPVEDVRQAYNNTIAVMPQLEQERNRPFLLSMVRRQLAQNRMYDPAEMTQIAGAAAQMARTQQAIEASAAQLQQRMAPSVSDAPEYVPQVSGITEPFAEAKKTIEAAGEKGVKAVELLDKKEGKSGSPMQQYARDLQAWGQAAKAAKAAKLPPPMPPVPPAGLPPIAPTEEPQPKAEAVVAAADQEETSEEPEFSDALDKEPEDEPLTAAELRERAEELQRVMRG